MKTRAHFSWWILLVVSLACFSFITFKRIENHRRALEAKEASELALDATEKRIKAQFRTITAKLAARNPKPDQDRIEWSDTDHQVFELLSQDRPEAIKEAMDLIWEEIRQPEPWLIDMRRKLGVTNIYAPVGPGLEGKP